MGKTSSGIEENIAGLLCYLLGFVTGIVFLLIEKENRFVRFHAWQSIITFLAIFVLNLALNTIPILGAFINVFVSLAAFIIWILLMVKAYQGQLYKLPVIGDIVEKNVR